MKRIGFDQLFAALPSPHLILDRDLRFVAVNAAYEAALGQDEAELIGRDLFDVFPNGGEAGQRLRASFERVLETGERDTLAFIRYEIPRPASQGGGFEERYWSAVNSPLKGENGEVLFILQNTVDITELARLREASAVPFRVLPAEVELVQRAREAEAAYATTRGEMADFERLFDQAPSMIAVLHGPRHVIVFANEAYKRFVGKRDVVGLAVGDALSEMSGQGFGDMLDAVYATGETRSGDGVAVRVRRAPDGPMEEAYMDFSFQPIRNAAGAVTGVFVQGSDRTEAMRADRSQRLLIDELNHRVKNTLATVQSLARQSFRDAEDHRLAQRAFEARIMALSAAHNLLSEQRWEAAELSALLRQEMSAFDPNQVTVEGPTVRLSPKAAIALAMAFHELARNAAVHGALAKPGGTLAVRWQIGRARGGEQAITLEWQERCKRAVDPNFDPGFGIKMLGRIVEGELDGRMDMALGEGGLACRFSVPLREVESIAVTDAN